MTEPETTPANEHRDTSRLETFCDGVIAIAITLLVLELRVPVLEDATDGAVWSALIDLWPSYLGYVISFATIGILWANHHTIFRLIGRTDHYLILLNLLLLFFIAVIPFTTALMTEYLGHSGDKPGSIVYAGWFLLAALSYRLLWWYVVRHEHLWAPGTTRDQIAGITARFRIGPPVYFAAFVLAFINTWASLIVMSLLAIVYVLPYNNVE